MPQSYAKEIREVTGLAGEVMDAFTTVLFLVEEPKRERLIMAACHSPSLKLNKSAAITIGHGLVGWVAKHGRPASAALKGEASNLLFYTGAEEVNSFAAAPIFDGDRLIGVLAVDSKSQDIFIESRIRLLGRFASTVGDLIVRGKKNTKLSADSSDIKAISELAESVGAGMAPADLLLFLRTRLPAIIPHEQLALAVRNLRTGAYDLLGSGQGKMERGNDEPFSITHYRFGWVIHQARAIYLADLNAPVIPGDKGEWRSFIGAPILADGEVYGAMGLMSRKPQAFKRADADVLSLLASALVSAIAVPALKERVRIASLTDPVTKTLFYRTLLDRHKDLYPSGVVALVDLKGFRHVNKELEPKGGDNILAQMADRLKKSMGETARICRYSADTFMVILPGVDMGRAQKMVIATLDEMESNPFHYNGVDVHITPVAGMAACPEDGKSSEELLIKACDALRATKSDPGRRTLFHSDLHLVEMTRKVAE
ncbi:MAG: GAF domain-containing protein [Nitrospinota bacterium]|nr:GAF domain-containing protein [Nitrospinota bacterium]